MEVWDAYDENRELLPDFSIQRAEWPYLHLNDVYHLAVNVWVQHEDGDWLFMRRSSQKSHYPGIYELGAGGSVLQGETSLEAAKRELFEETGQAVEHLDFLFSFTEVEHRTHFDTYIAQFSCSKDAIICQEEETDGYVWVPSADLDTFLFRQPVFQNQRQQFLDFLQKESD